ncbi:stage V sporulation protein K [Microdochium nivale]|nr:stage V sporulation protein K [Microdochium nivale]
MLIAEAKIDYTAAIKLYKKCLCNAGYLGGDSSFVEFCDEDSLDHEDLLDTLYNNSAATDFGCILLIDQHHHYHTRWSISKLMAIAEDRPGVAIVITAQNADRAFFRKRYGVLIPSELKIGKPEKARCLETIRDTLQRLILERLDEKAQVEGGCDGVHFLMLVDQVFKACKDELTLANMESVARQAMDAVHNRQLLRVARFDNLMHKDPRSLILTASDLSQDLAFIEVVPETARTMSAATTKEYHCPQAFLDHMDEYLPRLLDLLQNQSGLAAATNSYLNVALVGAGQPPYSGVAKFYLECLQLKGILAPDAALVRFRTPQKCLCHDSYGDNSTSSDDEDRSTSVEAIDLCPAEALRNNIPAMILIENAESLCETARSHLLDLVAEERAPVVLLAVANTIIPPALVSFVEDFCTATVNLNQAADTLQDRVRGTLIGSLRTKWGDQVMWEREAAGDPITACASLIAAYLGKDASQKDIEKAVGSCVGNFLRRHVSRRLKMPLLEKGSAQGKLVLTTTDIFGAEPDVNQLKCDEWEELQRMVGMENVKTSLQHLFNGELFNYWREVNGQEALPASLSRIFLGPPGTGKTTVAKLYGKTLAKLGSLSKGDLVIRNASEFIKPNIGDSAKTTKQILKEASGCVLLIDEAYILDPSRARDFGRPCLARTEIIDTLVGEVQNVPGEDRCIIMCGYKDEMERFLHNTTNPGFKRRFPMEQAFLFEDFTEDQLGLILDSKLATYSLRTTEEGRRTAMDVLKLSKQRSNFGNGGEVESLLTRAIANFQGRFGTIPTKDRLHIARDGILLPVDFDPDYLRMNDNITADIKETSGLLGLDKQFAFLQSISLQAAGMKKLGKDPKAMMPFTLVLKGPPGCGKTTFARHLGAVYHNMGVLASAEVVECSTSDLIGSWVGHTGPKTRAVLERALGKVLVIDEAYRLRSGESRAHDFAQEAIEELVDALTKPQFTHKLVIVLAGYTTETDQMLRQNPGLSGRFPTHIQFEMLSSESSVVLLHKTISCSHVTPRFHEHDLELRLLFDKLRTLENWASGRDVETLASKVVRTCFEKHAGAHSPLDQRNVLPVASQTLVLRIAQQWAHELGITDSLLPADDIEAAPLVHPSRYFKSGPYKYDVLYGYADTMRVLSFDEDDPSGDLISLRLETVDFTAWKTDYERLLRFSAAWSKKLDTSPHAIEHQQTSEAFYVWSHDGFSSDSLIEGEVKKHVLDSDRHCDTPDDIRNTKNREFIAHRYKWGDYLALSYVWGSSEGKEEIILNGHSFMVGRNLYSALRRLRQSTEVRFAKLKVWIDAICINQDDADERCSQVGKMRTIYSRAMCVRAWLGEPSPSNKSGFAMLAETMESAVAPGQDLERLSSTRSDLQTKAVQAATEFFSLTYWGRLWVIQEMALARSFVMWYGDSWVDSNRVRRLAAIEATAQNDFFHTPDDFFARQLRVSSITLKVLHLRLRPKLALAPFRPKSVRCIEAVLLARGANATDSRDKVYGILGLLPPSVSELIKIDYDAGITGEDAILSLSMACVMSEQDPTLRARFDLSPRQASQQGLPSWAFDLSAPVDQLDWHHTLASLSTFARSSATGSPVTTSLQFCPDGKLLHCTGYIADIITQIGPDINRELEIRSTDSIVEEHLVDGQHDQTTQENQHTTKTPQQDPRLSLARLLMQDARYNYADGPSPLDLPWFVLQNLPPQVGHTTQSQIATIARGVINAGQTAYANLQCISGAMRNSRDFWIGAAQLRDYFRPGTDCQASTEAYRGLVDAVIQQLEERNGRVFRGRLVMTSRGYLGLAPSGTQNGDVIALLPGSEDPVVLHPCGGEPCHQLVGNILADVLAFSPAKVRETAAALGLEEVEITLC